MSEEERQAILEKLTELEQALGQGAPTDTASKALYQCARLRHALEHSHSEGVRFSAFTLGHLLGRPDEGVAADVRDRFTQLKAALQVAGHRL